MNEQNQLIELGERVWRHRKEYGFTKKLPEEIQREAGALCKSGVTAYSIGKALGVPRNSVTEWMHRYADNDSTFSELAIVESPKTNFEVRLSATVQGCRVAITGGDYSLLQRLLRKMGS